MLCIPTYNCIRKINFVVSSNMFSLTQASFFWGPRKTVTKTVKYFFFFSSYSSSFFIFRTKTMWSLQPIVSMRVKKKRRNLQRNNSRYYYDQLYYPKSSQTSRGPKYHVLLVCLCASTYIRLKNCQHNWLTTKIV